MVIVIVIVILVIYIYIYIHVYIHLKTHEHHLVPDIIPVHDTPKNLIAPSGNDEDAEITVR